MAYFCFGLAELALFGMGVIVGRLDNRDNQRQHGTSGHDRSDVPVRSRIGMDDMGDDRQVDTEKEIEDLAKKLNIKIGGRWG